MADQEPVLTRSVSKDHLGDYTIDQHGALRHKKCGGQIAVEAELYVIVGFGSPRRDEIKGCRVERGPHGITIARKFGGYRGFCMKCQREGNFYGPCYRARRKARTTSSDRTRVQRLRFHVSRWARASAMSIG